jgi:hypothetical protein
MENNNRLMILAIKAKSTRILKHWKSDRKRTWYVGSQWHFSYGNIFQQKCGRTDEEELKWNLDRLIESFKESCKEVNVELAPNSFTIYVSDYEAFNDVAFSDSCVVPYNKGPLKKCFDFKPRKKREMASGLTASAGIDVLIDGQMKSMSIEKIVNMWASGEKSLLVKSYNTRSKKIEWKPIIDVRQNLISDNVNVVDYIYSNGLGTIRTIMSDNLRLRTRSSKWITAKNLKEEVVNDANDLIYFDLGIHTSDIPTPIELYQLNIQGNHNFFANDLLVGDLTRE